MNYEQARQIGPDGPAPGKWNWTNANDSVQPAPFTVAPCAYPDFEWPPFDSSKAAEKVTPTGRERCDHDTQEEAERHHWRYELGRVRLEKLDLDTLRERRRCDVPECPNWEEYRARWADGYVVDALCQEHYLATPDLHPFAPGMQEIHS